MRFIQKLFKRFSKQAGSGGIVDAYIALGGNLGDSSGYINKAVKKLDELEGVVLCEMSRVVSSRALADSEQPDYLDAVVRVRTKLGADELLSRLIRIEDILGRRRGKKWAPRTIDLDLLLYGDEIIDKPNLKVPHSQMHLRSFAADRVAEISPDLIHPELGVSMKEVSERLNGENFYIDIGRGALISVAGVIGAGKTTLAKAISKRLGCELVLEAYDSNPYVEEVFEGNSDKALDCQLYFLKSRAGQLNKDRLIKGEPIVSDYVFDKEVIYSRRMLSEEQKDEYDKHYRDVVRSIAEPVLTIYLRVSPEVCLERINKRNREYERQIDLQLLEIFYNDYEKLFCDWKKSPLIKIDGDKFDTFDGGEVDKLVKQVKMYI